MVEKKLTDEAIVKALECCANWDGQKDCDLCPIGVIKCFEQENLMPQLALDLINRLKEGRKTFFRIAKQRNEEKRELEKKIDEQQAEIERLKEENFVLYRDRFTKKELDDIADFRVKKATAELQKQVDGLKASREIEINELHEQHAIVAEEIKKDTAKEIFTDLLKEFSIRKSCGNAEVVVREMANRKGVEVE